MQINILTIFPDFFVSPLQVSMIKRAIESEKVKINIINIRDFATDKHSVTDDRPYGGGPGMVMKVEPIDRALGSIGYGVSEYGVWGMEYGVERRDRIILTSAKGKLFNQSMARDYAEKLDSLTIICGHYEGVDERVAEHLVDEEVRIGDYVITGGEVAAMVVADSVIRLLPGVLGNEESNKDESHSVPGKMGHAQYTRPEDYKGWKVPEVLLSGDHKKIEEWRGR